jgi:hypothetical protein
MNATTVAVDLAKSVFQLAVATNIFPAHYFNTIDQQQTVASMIQCLKLEVRTEEPYNLFAFSKQ